jgi:beta-xylosidase
MIEAITFWNEPNNKSHWDFEVDPDWGRFAEMVKRASHAVREKNPALIQVLGGTSPIDAGFALRLEKLGVLRCLDAFGVHGFPLDGADEVQLFGLKRTAELLKGLTPPHSLV